MLQRSTYEISETTLVTLNQLLPLSIWSPLSKLLLFSYFSKILNNSVILILNSQTYTQWVHTISEVHQSWPCAPSCILIISLWRNIL